MHAYHESLQMLVVECLSRCRCYRDSLDKEKNLCSRMFRHMREKWNESTWSQSRIWSGTSTLKWHFFIFFIMQRCTFLRWFALQIVVELWRFWTHLLSKKIHREWQMFSVFVIDSVTCSATWIITWLIRSSSDNCANKNLKGIGLLLLHFRAWFEIKMIKLDLKLKHKH